MARITDITAKFDELKPGIAADYVERVTCIAERLRERYPDGRMDQLSREWSRDGNDYRTVHRYYSYEGQGYGTRRVTGINADYLARQAADYADQQVAAFTHKLHRKLGDLRDVRIDDINVGGFTFLIYGTAPGGQTVRVEQNRILNVSPRGTLYHQWPSRIYVDGQFTPESRYKRLVAEAAGPTTPNPNAGPITVGSVIRVDGQPQAVTAERRQVARGVNPSINGQLVDYVYWTGADGVERGMPRRYARRWKED